MHGSDIGHQYIRVTNLNQQTLKMNGYYHLYTLNSNQVLNYIQILRFCVF